MAKNFVSSARDINLHTRKAEQTVNRLNPKTFMPDTT